jgi:hypothetical protein
VTFEVMEGVHITRSMQTIIQFFDSNLAKELAGLDCKPLSYYAFK